MYYEEDYRGLETEISRIVSSVLAHYGITFEDVLRIVVQELSLTITNKLVDLVKYYYNKYKDRK